MNKKRIIITAIIIIALTAVAIYLLRSQRHFYRRSIREIESIILSGDTTYSPVIVVLLETISTAIPLLPLPIPLIEIATGLVFGFWEGFLVAWIAQIISSLIAFYLAKRFGKKILNRFNRFKFLEFYKNYLGNGQALSVFILRAVMAAPFNLVSFLAGLTDMKALNFTVATALGTIPEALLYSFIGSQIMHTRLSLGIVFAIVILLAGLGLLITYGMIEFKNWRDKLRQHDL